MSCIDEEYYLKCTFSSVFSAVFEVDIFLFSTSDSFLGFVILSCFILCVKRICFAMFMLLLFGCIGTLNNSNNNNNVFLQYTIETWKKWSNGNMGPGGRISGSVCGLDPK